MKNTSWTLSSYLGLVGVKPVKFQLPLFFFHSIAQNSTFPIPESSLLSCSFAMDGGFVQRSKMVLLSSLRTEKLAGFSIEDGMLNSANTGRLIVSRRIRDKIIETVFLYI
jgi:hypothetical protein